MFKHDSDSVTLTDWFLSLAVKHQHQPSYRDLDTIKDRIFTQNNSILNRLVKQKLTSGLHQPEVMHDGREKVIQI